MRPMLWWEPFNSRIWKLSEEKVWAHPLKKSPKYKVINNIFYSWYRKWGLLNYVATCSGALRASSSTCSRISRASCPIRSRASHVSSLTCSRALRDSCPTYSHASRTSYLTCSNVNHYHKQPLLKELYYSGFYIISDRNPQDSLIYVNLTTLILQPAFTRKPALWR